MKKNAYLVALVVVGLMITSMSAMASFGEEKEINNAKEPVINVIERQEQRHTLSMPYSQKENINFLPHALDITQMTSSEEEEKHPGIGRSPQGQIVFAWEDPAIDDVLWGFSLDDGEEFELLGYYDMEGLSTYPSIDYWGAGTKFYGTMIPSYDYLDGGPSFLLECLDPADSETWGLYSWDWSAHGWYDMLDVDIACDNSQEDWEFGFISLVSSTTYGDGLDDGAFIFYMNTEEGEAMIGWYYGTDGCKHTSCDIDHITSKTYAVYDYLNTEDENNTKWDLLVRVDNFANWDASGNLYQIEADEGNLTYPSVAVNDNDIIIAAENNGNVVALHSDRGMMGTPTTTIVEEGASSPKVSFAKEQIFVVSYVKDGNLYYKLTEDGGETWGDAVQINENDGSVIDEYKTADLCEKGRMAMWSDNQAGNADIFINTDVYEILEPILDIGIVMGGFGVSATLTNTGTMDDENVNWSIEFEEGQGLIILPSGRIKEGVEPTITAGGEVTVKTGLVLGFGMVSIIVSATGAEQSVSKTASGFVLGPFVLGVA